MADWKTIENPCFIFNSADSFAKFHFDYTVKKPPIELFHYTSSESFLKIIDSGCMLATEASCLNDPNEKLIGSRLLKKLLSESSLQRFSKEFLQMANEALTDDSFNSFKFFVMSLSEKSDLLSQWRAYAENGKGVAIGFDGTVLRDRAGFGEFTLNGIDLETFPNDYCYSFHLLKAIYEEEEQRQILLEFLIAANDFSEFDTTEEKTLFKLLFSYRLKEILISFKDAGFKEEIEWRIVASLHKYNKKIFFDKRSFGITPYIKLNLSERKILPARKLPISTIHIGPVSSAKEKGEFVEMLLKKSGYEVNICNSNLAYRG